MNATVIDVKVLVIGIGNPLRGDDAAGWFAAQWLAERVDADQVTTMAVHLLTPEWAQPLSHTEMVIFIDAAEGQAPGTLTIRQIAPADEPASITHQLTPQRLLALAQRLYGRAPVAFLCTVGGVDFGHKEVLSELVEPACQELVQRIDEMIQAHLEQENASVRY
jgi:hydrogenase maturation protease